MSNSLTTAKQLNKLTEQAPPPVPSGSTVNTTAPADNSKNSSTSTAMDDQELAFQRSRARRGNRNRTYQREKPALVATSSNDSTTQSTQTMATPTVAVTAPPGEPGTNYRKLYEKEHLE